MRSFLPSYDHTLAIGDIVPLTVRRSCLKQLVEYIKSSAYLKNFLMTGIFIPVCIFIYTKIPKVSIISMYFFSPAATFSSQVVVEDLLAESLMYFQISTSVSVTNAARAML